MLVSHTRVFTRKTIQECVRYVGRLVLNDRYENEYELLATYELRFRRVETNYSTVTVHV